MAVGIFEASRSQIPTIGSRPHVSVSIIGLVVECNSLEKYTQTERNKVM